MKNNFFLSASSLFLIFVFISGCDNSELAEATVDKKSNSLLQNIDKDLNQSKGVIVYQMVNDDRSSEQYADWSSYLNDFTSSQISNYVAYESNKELNDRLLNNKVNVTGSYTLFIKKGKPTYFYEGVIVESMVYMAVDNTYSNGAPSPMSQAFLPDVVDVDFQ